MKKRFVIKVLYVCIAFIVGAFIQFFFLKKLIVTTDLINNLIVFLSILFGFCATSLAIFSTSKFVSKLYKTEEPKDNSQTLLHTLVEKYKFGLFFSLFSVLYFLVLDLRAGTDISSTINLAEPLSLLFFSVVLLNFYFGFSLTEILSRIVIQEGKENGYE